MLLSGRLFFALAEGVAGYIEIKRKTIWRRQCGRWMKSRHSIGDVSLAVLWPIGVKSFTRLSLHCDGWKTVKHAALHLSPLNPLTFIALLSPVKDWRLCRNNFQYSSFCGTLFVTCRLAISSLCVLLFVTLRFAVNRHAKHGLSCCKRWPFTLLLTAFSLVVYRLLHCK